MLSVRTLLRVFVGRIKLFTLIVLSVLVAGFAIALIQSKQYTATAQVSIDVKANDPITGMPVSGLLAPSYLFTQADIIYSQNTALKVVDKIGITTLPEAIAQYEEAKVGSATIRDWYAELFLKSLEVVPSRQSNVISLSYTATDPVFAAQVANQFMKAYIDMNIEMRTQAAQSTSEFFQQQLKVLKKRVEDAQAELSKYQQETGIVASDERLDVETQRLNELSSSLVQAQSHTYDAKSRAQAGTNAPDVLNNPLIQQLKAQLSQKSAKLHEVEEKLGPNHPQYQQAQADYLETKNQLNQLQAQYSQGLGATANNSAATQASLKAALQEQRERIFALKKDRAQLSVLQQNLDNAQKTYDAALSRQAQSTLEGAMSGQTNIFPLKYASPPKSHSAPVLRNYAAVALLLGLVLASLIVLVVEYFNRRVRSADDLSDFLGVPLLVTMPSLDQRKSVLTKLKGRGK
ncbi:chain length determinant protein EpsF [Chitinibacter tainanensis]|uniref:chain length determinant protein EpsF n=1 Tax=Chitinibacter tainanensis TaxID=230667 RepID=UPI000A01D40D|nr:chain length determinant protein EpsF [Chitinibacter tainanensis]